MPVRIDEDVTKPCDTPDEPVHALASTTFERTAAVPVPFEPKTSAALELRAILRAGVRRLGCSEDSILHAVFSGPRPRGSDVENLVLYNIDSSGGSFLPAGRRGLRFELGASSTAHCVYRYESVPRSSGFRWWRRDAVLARFERVPLLRRPDDRQQVWWALHDAPVDVRGTVRDVAAPFSISLEVHPPEGTEVGIPRLVKPLVDGIVCALQRHTDAASLDEVSARVGRALGREPREVAARLTRRERGVLGAVACLVRPWGRSVQWHPSDEECVAGEVLLGAPVGEHWALSGTVHEVERRT